jgi:hypothetical protein
VHPSYSAWADWLDKFTRASEMIQALWIVAAAATIVAVTWVVMRGLIAVVRSWPVSYLRDSRTVQPRLEPLTAEASGRALLVTPRSASPARPGSGLRLPDPE